MCKVDILMATYNGEKYIGNQIRSLQSQTYKEWRLYVHDDGSKDSTIAIVKDFAAQDKRIVLVEDGLTFHSPAYNFMYLLKSSTAPFVMFCDQDDIWLENKIEIMLNAIEKQDNSHPLAVYCNSYVYDSNTSSIGGSSTLCFPKTLKDVFFLNSGIQGCAIMFNARLRSMLNFVPNKIAMHDHVVTLAAATFGKLIYIDKRLMLYRRYADTVTGRTDKNLKEKLHYFFEKGKTVLSEKHYKAIHSFYNTYADKISICKKADFEDFFCFERENRLKRVFHSLKGNYRLYGSRNILILKLLIRPLL